MNAATAGGFLGGESSGKFTASNGSKDAGVCEFARASGSGTLRIEVELMKAAKANFASYLHKCGPDAKPLKAIGNEAVVCTVDRGQRVIGRVRGQAFVMDLIAANATAETAKKAAESIAGNLF